jgi:hypothetical protein
MSKKRRSELWQEEPAEHDYAAAAAYLSLLLPEQPVALVVEGLRTAALSRCKAKDLMRSSRLDLLPADDPEVAKELKRAGKGELLSPVLLVRGQLPTGVPLTIADGYHRICASYHLGEDASIPCRIADLP